MRRCGHNPTDVEVADIINKVHDDTDSLGFEVLFINGTLDQPVFIGILQHYGG